MLPDLSEVKGLRKKLGITQKQLAAGCGVTQGDVSKLESGKSIPRYDTAQKIFSFLERAKEKNDLKARQIMNPKLIFVSKKNRLVEAIKLMREHSISQLPVVEKGIVVGSVSEKTVLDYFAEGANVKKIPFVRVQEVLEEAFPSIDENAPIQVVSALLKYASAVIVSSKNKPLGIITKADLLKAFKEKV